MLNQLRLRVRHLERKHCLFWLPDGMRLLYQLLFRLLEGLRLHEEHRSFGLHRWYAIGCSDELPKERWPYRVFAGSCATKLMLRIGCREADVANNGSNPNYITVFELVKDVKY